MTPSLLSSGGAIDYNTFASLARPRAPCNTPTPGYIRPVDFSSDGVLGPNSLHQEVLLLAHASVVHSVVVAAPPPPLRTLSLNTWREPRLFVEYCSVLACCLSFVLHTRARSRLLLPLHVFVIVVLCWCSDACRCGAVQEGFGPFGLQDKEYSDRQREPIVTSQQVEFVRASNVSSSGVTASRTRTDGSVHVPGSVVADSIAVQEVRGQRLHCSAPALACVRLCACAHLRVRSGCRVCTGVSTYMFAVLESVTVENGRPQQSVARPIEQRLLTACRSSLVPQEHEGNPVFGAVTGHDFQRKKKVQPHVASFRGEDVKEVGLSC